MYNLLIKKYYLTKIFTLCLPKKKKSNKACFYLCKYFIKNTPYANIDLFVKETSRLLNIILSLTKKNFLFICSNNIFLYNFMQKKKIKVLLVSNFSKFQKQEKLNVISSVFFYNYTYNKKIYALIKNQKKLTIGFIDFFNQPNGTDYTLLLETKFFSSIFLFHFLLKKFIYNANN